MKPEKASLHTAVKRCFIIRRITSYGKAVLHKTPFQMKHCSTIVSQYEAFAFANMKHSAYAPYDVRKCEMRVYPFAIQRYPHYIMTCNPVFYDRIFLCLDFTHRIASIYSNTIAPTENKQRMVKSLFSDIFLRILRQILFSVWKGPQSFKIYTSFFRFFCRYSCGVRCNSR